MFDTQEIIILHILFCKCHSLLNWEKLGLTSKQLPQSNAIIEIKVISDDVMSSQESDSDGELDRNWEVTSSPTQDYLLPLLECPVCFNLPLPPIRTCYQGHIICASCCLKLSGCPLCAKPIGIGRNFFAEDFLSRSTMKCKYAEDGCGLELQGEKLKGHMIRCKFRPIKCPRCHSKVAFKNFEDHLHLVHSVGRWDLDDGGTRIILQERKITSRFNDDFMDIFSTSFVFKALLAALALSFLTDQLVVYLQ